MKKVGKPPRHPTSKVKIILKNPPMQKNTNTVPHWTKLSKQMDHNGNTGNVGGLILTVLLWIVAKITLSDFAAGATIMSGGVVFFVNIPKMVGVWQKYFKKQKK